MHDKCSLHDDDDDDLLTCTHKTFVGLSKNEGGAMTNE